MLFFSFGLTQLEYKPVPVLYVLKVRVRVFTNTIQTCKILNLLCIENAEGHSSELVRGICLMKLSSKVVVQYLQYLLI